MKVKIIKPHHLYTGIVELPEDQGQYLIKVGAAELAKEKKETVVVSEKKENKNKNVPTAKKK